MNTLSLAAIVLCGAGLAALRVSWRRSDMLARLTLALGWALLAAATFASVKVWGIEFGLSYSLASFSLIAMLLVGFQMERRPPVLERERSDTKRTTTKRQKFFTFFTAGPLAGLVSCQVTLLLALVMPGTQISNMAAAALGFPILWSILAYLLCLAKQPGKHALKLVALAAGCSLVLYL